MKYYHYNMFLKWLEWQSKEWPSILGVLAVPQITGVKNIIRSIYNKNWLIWKDPDAGEDWRQEEPGTAENVMVGWHHQLNGHELE